MTAESELAVMVAVNFEAKKTGFGQAQDGWSLTLRILHEDVPASVRDAKKGTRYQVVLVELDDDDTPRIPESAPEPTAPEPAKPEESVPTDQRKWDEIPYPTRAGIRCAEKDFQTFLRGEYAVTWDKVLQAIPDGKDRDMRATVEVLRDKCKVVSRSEIKPGSEAAKMFDSIESQYRMWLRHEKESAA